MGGLFCTPALTLFHEILVPYITSGWNIFNIFQALLLQWSQLFQPREWITLPMVLREFKLHDAP